MSTVGSGQSMRPRLVLFWLTAQAIGVSGTRLINVAVPWFVLSTTRDPFLTGIVVFVQMAPLVVAKALSGPLIDRVGPVRVAVSCDLLSILAVGAIPIADAGNVLSTQVLMVLVAVEGLLRGPADVARYSLCPQISEAAGLPLETTTGLAGTVERLAVVVGAGLGGLIIAAVGAPNALWVSCVTFASGATILWVAVRPGIRGVREPDQVEEHRSVHGYINSLAIGFRFLRTDAVLVWLTVIIAMINLLEQAFLGILVPQWAVLSGGGASAVGFVLALVTSGAVVGALCASAVGSRMPRMLTYALAMGIAGLPRFVVLGFDSPAWLLYGLLISSGFASGFVNPIYAAVMFERIPKHLIGRVSALQMAAAWSLMPVGGLVGGVIVSGVGLRAALFAFGFVYLVVALAPLASSRFRAGFARRR